MSDTFGDVARHYGEAGIGDRILAALAGKGIDTDNLTTADLATIDQFHTRGLPATREQADMVAPNAETHVLDIGCCVGGPARFLAETYGCRVTGIDLTEEYVDVADMLSRRCGLDHLTDFRIANALNLPFDDCTFDLAWTQNVSMNIPDKAAFYASIFRVLKPGGKFSSSEVATGAAGEPVYPLPWAREPSISFVASPDEMKASVEAAGFRILDWQDTTAEAVAVFRNPNQTARRGKLGVGLVAGADFGERSANLAQGMADGRFSSVLFVAERPG
jgi:sarcosine/dimethylglycine N-methyltransferase